ncbi:hypothetical protein [Paractinoplanes durhamensis]|uniref:hypothetical protein n=1 Tax=Paractinoplanes durhamensis TaxID=113563 RepID=UPI0036300DC7
MSSVPVVDGASAGAVVVGVAAGAVVAASTGLSAAGAVAGVVGAGWSAAAGERRRRRRGHRQSAPSSLVWSRPTALLRSCRPVGSPECPGT